MSIASQPLRLNLIRSYRERTGQHWNYPAYRRPYNWLIHTFSGRGEVKLQNRSIALQPNSVVILPLNQLAHYRCSEPMQLGSCAFTLQANSGLDVFELYNPPLKPIVIADKQLIEQVINAGNSDSDYFSAVAAMYQLLTPIIEQSEEKISLNKNYRQLEKVIELVAANIHSPLSISDIAEFHGTSTAHFSRWFSAIVGVSPKKYIIGKRIDAACKLLLFSNHKIEAIAYKCGFEDPLYFSKSFKKSIGLTPSEYRKTKIYDLPDTHIQ
ncbi:AraC family transcriptional regulator ['Osedax' symbiont bacterium Rs2_46_30_T18]|nr:AraC family transcriptional regulator ['Osedax' symbiont bacterium Rs2_46_30_T18]